MLPVQVSRCTALDHAIRHACEPMQLLLLSYGADVRIINATVRLVACHCVSSIGLAMSCAKQGMDNGCVTSYWFAVSWSSGRHQVAAVAGHTRA